MALVGTSGTVEKTAVFFEPSKILKHSNHSSKEKKHMCFDYGFGGACADSETEYKLLTPPSSFDIL